MLGWSGRCSQQPGNGCSGVRDTAGAKRDRLSAGLTVAMFRVWVTRWRSGEHGLSTCRAPPLSARRGSHILPLFLRTSPSPKRRNLFAVSSAAQTSPLLTFATLRRRHHLRLASSVPPSSASLRLRLLKDCLIRSTSRPDEIPASDCSPLARSWHTTSGPETI